MTLGRNMNDQNQKWHRFEALLRRAHLDSASPTLSPSTGFDDAVMRRIRSARPIGEQIFARDFFRLSLPIGALASFVLMLGVSLGAFQEPSNELDDEDVFFNESFLQ